MQSRPPTGPIPAISLPVPHYANSTCEIADSLGACCPSIKGFVSHSCLSGVKSVAGHTVPECRLSCVPTDADLGGFSRDLATLIAGDFFGEMALLHGTRRMATCRAITPSALYELRRDDMDVVRKVCPEIQRALEEADQRRRAEIRESGAVADM